MNCKNILGKIDPNRDNAHDFPLLFGLDENVHFHLGTFDAVHGNFPAPSGRGNPFHSLGIWRLAVDLRYFLSRRMDFIRQFYEMSAAPFIERKRQIEDEEEPFVPPYSENPEPPFLDEWLEAEESLQVLGRTCISMLAAAFHLYFKTWERQIGIPVDASLKGDFKNGWLNGYKAYFERHFQIRFGDSPIKIDVLEEIVLVRNRTQHPESITMDSSHYSESDLKKFPRPFFIDEGDAALFSEIEKDERAWLIPPSIRVTAEKLFSALSEVKRFAEWLETVEVEHHAS